MTMLWVVITAATTVPIALYWWCHGRKHGLEHLPGPLTVPVLGNLHLVRPAAFHFQLLSWAQQYGDVYRLMIGPRPTVVVTGADAMHACLVKKSRDFSGRPHWFRADFITNGGKDVLGSDDCPARQVQKKMMSKQIKAFGQGLERVETITTSVLKRLISSSLTHDNGPISMHRFLKKCVFHITYIIIFERELTDPEEEATIVKLAERTIAIGNVDIMGMSLDAFPWLRFLGHPIYKQLQKFRIELQDLYVNKWKVREEKLFADNPTAQDGNLPFKLLKYIRENNTAGLDDEHVKYGAFDVIFAGISTTTETLASFFNIMVHYPDVQTKIQAEIDSVIGQEQVKIEDRQNMPYTQATILELLRFTAIAPVMIPHRTVCDTDIDGIKIPAGTDVLMNNWGQCHDDRVWDEPFQFQPERFLDEQGRLVLADHPNRVNLMPFGAGHRVCVGETFAMSRMFLVITMLLGRFCFLPAHDLAQQPSCDPRRMPLNAVMDAPTYNVRIVDRARM